MQERNEKTINDLTFDVRFALRKAPLLRTRQERNDDRWRDILAREIVEHLAMANWIFRRGQPEKCAADFVAYVPKDKEESR
jgi:hypothetical protein